MRNIFGGTFARFTPPGADVVTTVPPVVRVSLKAGAGIDNLLLVDGVSNLLLVDGTSVLKLTT